MAVYKVPQDVEADDKLLGPFSFRQFIYLVITCAGIALAWGLSRLFIPLAILPLPIIIFFGALALPLRKDQPMEIYLAAVVSFYLKPRKRLWQPDGIQSLVEITAPKVVEVQRTKDLSRTEAERRLSYLANIVDSEGWAVRGVTAPSTTNSAMQSDVYFSAQQTVDVLGADSGVSKSLDTMIAAADTRHRQEIVEKLHQTQPTPQPSAHASDPVSTHSNDEPTLKFNPYPSSIHQKVIRPIGEEPEKEKPITTSEKPVSPDIINLANNPDLSIETIAHEAQRIHEREQSLPENEVVISLR
jgi:hypothetical protein